jgi:V/A-type H+-transporting ATPase subunit D
MAILAVNPTRMELTRLKRRLVTARRGHKLLKDKRDELMKQFLEIARENRRLRIRVEEALMKVHASFTVAAAVMSPEMLMQSLMLPKQSVTLNVAYKNIMSVNVPEFDFKMKNDNLSDIYPYGFATTSGELDDAVRSLFTTLQDMLFLAQREKAAQLLASEIKKTRRRVNALEYIVIPELAETIRYITMKLDENERGNTIRLMKVKDMLLEQAIEEKRAQTERLMN